MFDLYVYFRLLGFIVVVLAALFSFSRLFEKWANDISKMPDDCDEVDEHELAKAEESVKSRKKEFVSGAYPHPMYNFSPIEVTTAEDKKDAT